ncbi:hypothetical protein BDD12DRAFT_802858 [Trichophaea hybrida]|nr:hypothetical protein BDD12DRAFT_802858 [Trichophaea hybrida]
MDSITMRPWVYGYTSMHYHQIEWTEVTCWYKNLELAPWNIYSAQTPVDGRYFEGALMKLMAKVATEDLFATPIEGYGCVGVFSTVLRQYLGPRSCLARKLKEVRLEAGHESIASNLDLALRDISKERSN